jgi:heme/copper-type cytochrome/quinol oxidase subunit 4
MWWQIAQHQQWIYHALGMKYVVAFVLVAVVTWLAFAILITKQRQK